MSKPPPASADPVRARRQQVARWTLLANRVGYLFVAVSMALFVIAFAVGFSPTMATLVTVTLVIGCVLLAPSIIVGYAVKAAERDDRERGF
jgi:heme/copper-type cytochrome/quinol oxidase subunit 3